MVGQPLFPDELVGALAVTEIAWGADLTAPPSSWTWYEVVPLQNPGIQYQIGKQQENNVAPPAQFTFALDNRNNDYTQYSPLCSNWPNVKEGTPARQRLIIASVSYTLIQGRIIGFQPSFDSTGKWATTVVTVAGRLRVDSNIKVPAKSPLYRAIMHNSPKHYIPLEGAVGTLIAPSVVTNDSATLTQAGGNAVTWASYTPEYTSPPYYIRFGTDNLPDLSKGGSLTTTNVSTSNASGWGLQFFNLFDALANGTAHVCICQWQTTDNRIYRLYMSSDGAFFGTTITVATDIASTESTVLNDNFTTSIFRDICITFAPTGGSTAVTFTYLTSFGTAATVAGVPLAQLKSVTFNPNLTTTTVPFVIGHFQVWDTPTYPFFSSSSILTPSAWTAWNNESVQTRLTRICDEDGIDLNFLGYYDSAFMMGPQFVDTIGTLLTECEQTLAGFKYDGLSDGVSFMAPSQRYDQFSQFTIDGTAGEIIPPFAPLPDDFLRTNRSIVTRRNGATTVYEAPPGGELSPDAVGVYERTLSPNPNYFDDTVIDDRARWEVHKGTIAGFRFPSISVNVRKVADRAAAIAAMLPGYMFTINTPLKYQPQLPSDDILLIAEGWTGLLIPPYRWEITFNTSLQDVYNVWKVSDQQLGRAGTNGHTLTSSIAANATSASLTTPSGSQTFTNTPSDFPFHIKIDGIKVRVHSIGANLLANGTFESGIANWSGQSGATIATDTIGYLSASSMKITPPGAVSNVSARADAVSATAGTSYLVWAWVYSVAGYSDVQIAVEWYDGTSTLITTSLPGSNVIPAATWTQISATVTAPASTATARFRVRIGSTPAVTDIIWADECVMTPTGATSSPQVATVSGVTKALTAGTPVTIWKNGVVKL